MATVTFEYKGIAEGKYTEGVIEALDRDEASFKLREKKVIIEFFSNEKSRLLMKIQYFFNTFACGACPGGE